MKMLRIDVRLSANPTGARNATRPLLNIDTHNFGEKG